MSVVHPFDFYDDLEEDVRQIITTEVNLIEPGRIIINENIWLGPVRPVVDSQLNAEGIWVMVTGGRESLPFMGGGGTEWRPGIQIRIRIGKGNNAYTRGAKLARQIFFSVDQYPPPACREDGTPLLPVYTPKTKICDFRSRSSHPLYLGVDSDGFHEWAVNVEAILAGQ